MDATEDPAGRPADGEGAGGGDGDADRCGGGGGSAAPPTSAAGPAGTGVGGRLRRAVRPGRLRAGLGRLLADPRKLLPEAAVIVAVLLLYPGGLLVVASAEVQALANAHAVLAAEAAVGLAVEGAVQAFVLGAAPVAHFLNHYYMLMHVPPMLALLGWTYYHRADVYPALRTVFVTVTLLGHVLHWTFPTAPPRLVPDAGFVDTLALLDHPLAYQGATTGAFVNPYAAMPSLHFAWALLVAGALFFLLGRPWRYLAPVHPALMLFAIVGTGNHFVLDAFAGAALATGVAAVARVASLRARDRRPGEGSDLALGLWGRWGQSPSAASRSAREEPGAGASDGSS